MDVALTSLHWIYVGFIILIIGFMVNRRDTTLICILGIFTLALTATGSLSASVSGIFNSFAFAITELISTIVRKTNIIGIFNKIREYVRNSSHYVPQFKILF